MLQVLFLAHQFRQSINTKFRRAEAVVRLSSQHHALNHHRMIFVALHALVASVVVGFIVRMSPTVDSSRSCDLQFIGSASST